MRGKQGDAAAMRRAGTAQEIDACWRVRMAEARAENAREIERLAAEIATLKAGIRDRAEVLAAAGIAHERSLVRDADEARLGAVEEFRSKVVEAISSLSYEGQVRATEKAWNAIADALGVGFAALYRDCDITSRFVRRNKSRLSGNPSRRAMGGRPPGSIPISPREDIAEWEDFL